MKRDDHRNSSNDDLLNVKILRNGKRICNDLTVTYARSTARMVVSSEADEMEDVMQSTEDEAEVFGDNGNDENKSPGMNLRKREKKDYSSFFLTKNILRKQPLKPSLKLPSSPHQSRKKFPRKIASVEVGTTDNTERDAISLESIIGLDNQTKKLKEMVSLPLIYPELFGSLNIAIPRGIIFHGPPGTGKTLLARALALSLKKLNNIHVNFYYKNVAECLSKYIGEAEGLLKDLFDEAAANQPSIIFFDELDGIAPIRSEKQEQSYVSLVTTMLTCMDGLVDRGRVIVIGATNRIDSVDEALRRPGRFDRELYFPLPALSHREELFKFYTSKWANKPSKELLKRLSERTAGYSGADIKSLCAESALNALRRLYPDIYTADKRLCLKEDDFSSFRVNDVDFWSALYQIQPSSSKKKSTISMGKPISFLIQSHVNNISDILTSLCTPTSESRSSMLELSKVLVHGEPEGGQALIVETALLQQDHYRVHSLCITELYKTSYESAVGVFAKRLEEAALRPPSILYIPYIDRWWTQVPEEIIDVLLTFIVKLSPAQLILVAFTDTLLEKLPTEIRNIFNFTSSLYKVTVPNMETCESFFNEILSSFFVDLLPTSQRNLNFVSIARKLCSSVGGLRSIICSTSANISLGSVLEKAQKAKYETIDEFMKDIENVAKNVELLCSDGKDPFSHFSNIEKAKRILSIAQEEVRKIVSIAPAATQEKATSANAFRHLNIKNQEESAALAQSLALASFERKASIKHLEMLRMQVEEFFNFKREFKDLDPLLKNSISDWYE